MKALEFKTRIKNNQIQIPLYIQSELKPDNDRDIRVIVLFDDSENNDDLLVKEASAAHFLKGFAESDSIYDKY
jgi:hypothetical protein